MGAPPFAAGPDPNGPLPFNNPQYADAGPFADQETPYGSHTQGSLQHPPPSATGYDLSNYIPNVHPDEPPSPGRSRWQGEGATSQFGAMTSISRRYDVDGNPLAPIPKLTIQGASGSIRSYGSGSGSRSARSGSASNMSSSRSGLSPSKGSASAYTRGTSRTVGTTAWTAKSRYVSSSVDRSYRTSDAQNRPASYYSDESRGNESSMYSQSSWDGSKASGNSWAGTRVTARTAGSSRTGLTSKAPSRFRSGAASNSPSDLSYITGYHSTASQRTLGSSALTARTGRTIASARPKPPPLPPHLVGSSFSKASDNRTVMLSNSDFSVREHGSELPSTFIPPPSSFAAADRHANVARSDSSGSSKGSPARRARPGTIVGRSPTLKVIREGVSEAPSATSFVSGARASPALTLSEKNLNQLMSQASESDFDGGTSLFVPPSTDPAGAARLAGSSSGGSKLTMEALAANDQSYRSVTARQAQDLQGRRK